MPQATHLDVVGHDGHVLEVQGGVNLVHHIEGRGLVVVQGKDQGEGGEGLLPAGQVCDVLPRLLGRPHLQRAGAGGAQQGITDGEGSEGRGRVAEVERDVGEEELAEEGTGESETRKG